MTLEERIRGRDARTTRAVIEGWMLSKLLELNLDLYRAAQDAYAIMERRQGKEARVRDAAFRSEG